jgi:bacteriocin-like protein
MYKKNLLSQATQPNKRITIQDLLTEFAEISDKDLQQIVGGGEPATASGRGGTLKTATTRSE